jgi:tRNA pseudouridine32 synthase/23S rRNA pseudouridine746 synthase
MKIENRIRMMASAPLMVRDGVAPSRVYLPHGNWQCLGDFLFERFPHVAKDDLCRRIEQGDVVNAEGQGIGLSDPYVSGQWLWYYREVPDETPVPFDLPILFQDDRLLVVDKPHFLASVPGGRYLKETALTRLRASLNLPLLTPVHRLDRETAGVLMFCIDPVYRGAYQALFQSRSVAKTYEAIAPVRDDLQWPLTHRSRLSETEMHFTMREVQGVSNSETCIDVLQRGTHRALYRLKPLTGRKHQLRVHMSALGLPLINDGFYPILQPYADADDFSKPLQLLARSLSFKDPVDGRLRSFISERQLCLDSLNCPIVG